MSADWRKDPFSFVGWDALLTEAEERDCRAYASVARRWRDREIDPDRQSALAILADLLSLQIRWNGDRAEQLGPSHLLDAVPREAVAALSEWVPKISDPELQARFGDAAWLKQRAGSVESAELAVRGYLQVARAAYDPLHWTKSFAHLQRAVRLAASLGKTGPLFSEATEVALALLARTHVDEPRYFTKRVVELLLEYRQGAPKELASAALFVADAITDADDAHRARDYLDVAAACYDRAGDATTARAIRVRIAVSLETEAIGAGGDPFHAVRCLEQAISVYRRLGGTSAETQRLRLLLQRERQKAVAAMKPHVLPFDLSKCVEHAEAAVRDKPAGEALVALVGLSHPQDVAHLRDEAVRRIGDSPLRAFIRQEKLSRSGRVVHAHAGVMDDSGEAAIVSAMHEHVAIVHQVFGRGGIRPALRILQNEHGLRMEDFYFLAQRSPFVQPGREVAYAKGLVAGFYEDFFTAAHILIPQFENSVRWLLSQRGVVTVTLPTSGVQNELDLNALLSLPEATTLFGAAVVFDMQSLLTEKAGTNLRNEMAHGLIEDGQHDDDCAYAWWLVLRCVIAPLLQTEPILESGEDDVTNTEEHAAVERSDDSG